MTIVAALFVDPRGVYASMARVDCWDEGRDARRYPGPYPVIAHPPCSRWCKPLAFVNQTRYGHKVGDVEHPANSAAWDAFDLRKPQRGGWLPTECGGWVCSVAQSAYGHKAVKRTWLYYVGAEPPALEWGDGEPTATVSWLPNTKVKRPRLSKREAKATPRPFANLLLSLARSSSVDQPRPLSQPPGLALSTLDTDSDAGSGGLRPGGGT